MHKNCDVEECAGMNRSCVCLGDVAQQSEGVLCKSDGVQEDGLVWPGGVWSSIERGTLWNIFFIVTIALVEDPYIAYK